MKRLFWSGICRKDRIPGISEIQDCASQYGYIIDYKLFSDISVSMVIEAEKRKVLPLFNQLKSIIALSGDRDNLKDFPTSEGLENVQSLADNDIEVTIYLHVTFTAATGNLTIVAPAVPG